MVISKEKLAKMIDSTAVKATATKGEIAKLCKEAVQYGFGCVCVNPVYIKLAATLLKSLTVKVCSTIAFPFEVTLPE